jgi:hypothetical protein
MKPYTYIEKVNIHVNATEAIFITADSTLPSAKVEVDRSNYCDDHRCVHVCSLCGDIFVCLWEKYKWTIHA